MRSFGAAISMRLFRRPGEEKPGAVLSSGIGAGGRAAARPAGWAGSGAGAAIVPGYTAAGWWFIRRARN